MNLAAFNPVSDADHTFDGKTIESVSWHRTNAGSKNYWSVTFYFTDGSILDIEPQTTAYVEVGVQLFFQAEVK